jgi:hypothetical protein
MKPYLYLSLIPEALIASHLSPEKYGAYLAIGARKRSRGQAIFFKLSDDYAAERLHRLGLDSTLERTAPHLRQSCYLSVYRVLEEIPLHVIESLHLVAGDGRVLTLQPGAYAEPAASRYYLYQEFCPATPRIVSMLPPRALAEHITDARQRVSLPAVAFADLRLDRLSVNPDATDVNDLPYANLDHLRDCLRELQAKPNKVAKSVVRFLQQDVLFRTLQNGFYVASRGGDFRYFPMPSQEDLETLHAHWWRSALSNFGG